MLGSVWCRRLVAVADYPRRWSVTGPTNLLHFSFPNASLERTASARFSASGSICGHGCTTTKTETLLSVTRVSLTAYHNILLQSAHYLEPTFISTGFSNWKDPIHQCLVDVANDYWKHVVGIKFKPSDLIWIYTIQRNFLSTYSNNIGIAQSLILTFNVVC